MKKPTLGKWPYINKSIKKFIVLFVLFQCIIPGFQAQIYLSLQNKDLVWLDINTCKIRLLGNSNIGPYVDIAVCPNGKMYGIANGNLYTIDTNNANGTLVGPLSPAPASPTSLVCDKNNVLFTAEGGGTNLYSINPATGATVKIGNIGYSSAGDLTFYNDTLYMAGSNNALVKIKKSTAPPSAVLIGTMKPSGTGTCVVGGACTQQGCTSMSTDPFGNCTCTACGGNTDVWGIVTIQKPDCLNPTQSMLATASTSIYTLDPLTGGLTMKCSNVVNSPIWGATSPTESKIICNFSVSAIGDTLCPGTCGSITAKPNLGTAPYTYTWQPGNLSGSAVAVCPTTTTSYTVTAKDAAGLSATATARVLVNPVPVITVPPATICPGNSTTLTASGADTYTWSPTTGLSSGTGTSVTANPTVTSTYTVIGTTTATGCTGITTVIVTVNPNPVISVPPATICTGTSATLTAGGATTYTWSPTTGLSSGTGTSVTANPTATSTYTVIGTTSGCTGSTTVIVTVNPNPVVTVPGATICPGASAPLTASGATTYTWSPLTGLSSGTGTSVTANPTVTSTYTVIGTTNGCTDSVTVVVTVLPPCGPGVNAAGSTVCNGVCGTVSSTAFGGTSPYTYSWNTGETTSGMTPAVCPTVTTTYTVTVTDNSVPPGSASAIAVITVNPNPMVSVPPATICDGASATLTASGATTYTWTPTTGLSSGAGTSVNANPNTTTTYTVTGSDPTGCTGTTTVVVTVNSIPVVTVPNASICPGGSTPLTASGAISYTWSPTTGLSSGTGTTVTANPSATTTYTVIGTGTGGCTSSTTVVVNVGALVATVSPDKTICFGASTPLTAGGGSIYSWTPATGLDNPNISNPVASPTVTTTYTVVVSDAMCSDDAVVVITVDPAITLNVAPVNVTCFGACNGQTIVIPTGGNGSFTYSWSSGCTLAACSNVCAGTYTLTATDGLGCTATGNTTVTEPTALTVVNASTNVSCFGLCDGTASVTANGGTAPYTYLWLPGGGAMANVTGLCAGSYTCTVTDANNCSVKTSVTITQPTAVIVTSTGATLCPNQCATLNANGSGGTGAITFGWNPGALTGASVSVCPAATTVYTITGTDANGCTGGTSVTVTVNPSPVITVPPATICEKTSTTLTASGANTYTWSPTTGLSSGTGASVTANPTSTTTYTVLGTSSFGCTNSTTVVVTVNPVPVITSPPASVCPNEDTTLTASGALSYIWTPAASLSSNTGASVIARPELTTTYTITGISANGCTASTTVTVTVHPKPTADFSTSPDKVDEFNPTVYFNDQSTGGMINSWKWNFGDSANTNSYAQNPMFIYPPVSRQYTIQLIVTNQFGCIDTTTGTVFIHGIFTFYIPNTFTPNGDGVNDGFFAKGVGIDETDYDLWVFDRWGNLIWHTEIWGEAWDGRANGGADVAQIDTYVWKVHVREKDNHAIHNYIGHVNIVK